MTKQFINPQELFAPQGFTQVVTASSGKMIFISGQVSFNEKAELIGKGDLRAQTTQTFENLRTALKAAGADFKDVVKMNYYVVGLRLEEVAIIREIRNKFLPVENPPASTLVGVEALVIRDLLIEIEAVAVIS